MAWSRTQRSKMKYGAGAKKREVMNSDHEKRGDAKRKEGRRKEGEERNVSYVKKKLKKVKKERKRKDKKENKSAK